MFTALALIALLWPPAAPMPWVDPQATAATTYNVYRAPGICPASLAVSFPLAAPAFVLLASGVTGTNYADQTVLAGANYCYIVTAVDSGVEDAVMVYRDVNIDVPWRLTLQVAGVE